MQRTDPVLSILRGWLADLQRSWPSHESTLILAWLVLNLLYLLSSHELSLAPDEAHYWLWSRQLDWGYYSKGPVVAWFIRIGCELCGNTVLGIRLPALLCHACTLLAMRELLREVLPARQVVWAMLALISLPGVSASAMVMTIDAPLFACWSWACVWLLRATQHQRHLGWLLAGLLTAIGVLAKLTMLLLPMCLLMYATVRQRDVLKCGLFWLFLGVSSLGLIPLILWNRHHDWVQLRHLLSHAKVDGSTAGWSLLGPLVFLGGQMALLQGIFFLAWVLHLRSLQTSSERFFAWLSLPVFSVFLLASLRGAGPLNWAAPAIITAWPLAAGWLVHNRDLRWVRWGVPIAVLAGFSLSVAARFPSLLRPGLAAVLPAPSVDHPAPIRRLDPTARLAGWPQLAAAVDRVRAECQRDTGEDPALAAMTWHLPGQLSFYCTGQPTVYSFGPITGDRHSQFDFWEPNPVRQAQVFRGQSFVYVGELSLDIITAFDRVGTPVEVIASDGGIPVASWKIYRLDGFRGFAAKPRHSPPRY